MKTAPARSRAFVLTEAMTLVVVCVVVLAVVMVASKRSRSLASLGESMANLRQMHQGTAAYGDDNASLFATFSWRKGNNLPSQWADLRSASSDVQAAARQAVDIIRRRANLSASAFPWNGTGWIPHIYYSHLVFEDYLGISIPSRMMISPEDKDRLAFALNRQGWSSFGLSGVRWAFSSSYELPVAFWSLPDSGPDALSQSSYSLFDFPVSIQLGNRRLDEVTYPAHKALYFDRHQRHFGPRQGVFMHEEARIPAAMVDGHVTVRRGENVNPGWQPRNPTSPNPLTISYQPGLANQPPWDPPALSPTGTDMVNGRYRYTRNALFGRDVDGPEVP